MHIKPYSDIQVTCRQIPEWERIPNTSLQSKPLMIYRQAFYASADELSEHLEKFGEVPPSWAYSIRTFTRLATRSLVSSLVPRDFTLVERGTRTSLNLQSQKAI
ncbi:hypothetical protein BJY00DRAFT_273989 [Aspergillus carlsbadensis]|nr:hypothetical protein BJY00DRAFT_273989 [Aspergillus carlsbadensis]